MPARAPQPPPPLPPPKAEPRTPYASSDSDLTGGGVAAVSTPTIFLGIGGVVLVAVYVYHPEWFSKGGDAKKSKSMKNNKKKRRGDDSDSSSESDSASDSSDDDNAV